LDSVLEKTCTLVVRVVNFKENNPVKNVNITVFRVEKEPITLKQWGENLKNGTPFKRLVLSEQTDNNGKVTAELPEGDYEAKAEENGLNKACKLTQNVEILFVEPKKSWWKSS
jgi:5-hydroxyisourate hydrolase-like protein (transthyretin family)